MFIWKDFQYRDYLQKYGHGYRNQERMVKDLDTSKLGKIPEQKAEIPQTPKVTKARALELGRSVLSFPRCVTVGKSPNLWKPHFFFVKWASSGCGKIKWHMQKRQDQPPRGSCWCSLAWNSWSSDSQCNLTFPELEWFINTSLLLLNIHQLKPGKILSDTSVRILNSYMFKYGSSIYNEIR